MWTLQTWCERYWRVAWGTDQVLEVHLSQRKTRKQLCCSGPHPPPGVWRLPSNTESATNKILGQAVASPSFLCATVSYIVLVFVILLSLSGGGFCILVPRCQAWPCDSWHPSIVSKSRHPCPVDIRLDYGICLGWQKRVWIIVSLL